MTAARVRGSQRLVSNSATYVEQLEGMTALVEDWHAKVVFVWVRSEHVTYAYMKREEGSIDDVNSSEDFLLHVVEGHILAALKEGFEMSSLDEQPSSSLFPEGSSKLEPLQRSQLLLRKLQDVVKRHVCISFCHACEQTSESQPLGSVYEYACETLSLGLLLVEFMVAVRDGSRILCCWQYFLPIFHVTNRTNYSC